MSDVFQIYLAGGMQDLSFEEQNDWRERVCQSIITRHRMLNPRIKEVNVINPVDYYNFQDALHDTEKEVMRFDTNFVRNSDLVVVNANDPKSIGTSMEIAIAYEHHIPVLILNTENKSLHSWWVEMSDKIFDDEEKLCKYIADFYITMNHNSVRSWVQMQ